MLAWTSEGAWERFAGPVKRLTRLIPSEALVGYHLCYGTFPEWPMYEARDMELLVRMANFAVANSGRTVDWLHRVFPRCCAADRRGRRAAPPGRHRIAVHLRLRRGDVLRLRTTAGQGRDRDHARARPGGAYRQRLATMPGS